MNLEIFEIRKYEKDWTFLKKCKSHMQPNLFQVLSCIYIRVYVHVRIYMYIHTWKMEEYIYNIHAYICIYNKHIYIYISTRVSSCPGLISVARVNE